MARTRAGRDREALVRGDARLRRRRAGAAARRRSDGLRGDAAFGYTGRFMRHVKLGHREVDPAALAKLIDTAYTDMKRRLR